MFNVGFVFAVVQVPLNFGTNRQALFLPVPYLQERFIGARRGVSEGCHLEVVARDTWRFGSFCLLNIRPTGRNAQFINGPFARVRWCVALSFQGYGANGTHAKNDDCFDLRVMFDRVVYMMAQQDLLIFVAASVFLMVRVRLSYNERWRGETRLQAARSARVCVKMSNGGAIVVLVEDEPPANIFVVLIVNKARRVRECGERRPVQAGHSKVYYAGINNAGGEVRVVGEKGLLSASNGDQGRGSDRYMDRWGSFRLFG